MSFPADSVPPLPSQPPPLPVRTGGVFRAMAKASWMSVVLAVGVTFLLSVSGGKPLSATPFARIVIAGFSGLMLLTGLVCGIVALCGIPREGRKGILLPALTGLLLWLFLGVLAVPPFLKARQRAIQMRAAQHRPPVPIQHAPGATPIDDPELGLSFDLPSGYDSFSDETKPAGFKHAFLKPVSPGLNAVLLVKSLKVRIPPGTHIDSAQIPAGRGLSVERVEWQGLSVDCIRVPEKLGETDYLTLNVQIPLRREAIQLGFGGPLSDEKHLKEILAAVVASVEDKTPAP